MTFAQRVTCSLRVGFAAGCEAEAMIIQPVMDDCCGASESFADTDRQCVAFSADREIYAVVDVFFCRV